MTSRLIRFWYEVRYWFSPPWDTGIPAPELVRAIATLPPKRAIDIGCGTGTNLLYLAEQGWDVTGVDFIPRAIAKARKKLASFSPTLRVADVANLKKLNLPGPYDLALDMGCFHGLSAGSREKYIIGLSHWLRRGGLFLLYAWQPESEKDPRGVPKEIVLASFAKQYTLSRYEQGEGRASAWYCFTRK
jgi:SAM-dependent methyltransferase